MQVEEGEALEDDGAGAADDELGAGAALEELPPLLLPPQAARTRLAAPRTTTAPAIGVRRIMNCLLMVRTAAAPRSRLG